MLGGEPGEDTEEFLELQEKLKNPEKMTRYVKNPRIKIRLVSYKTLSLCRGKMAQTKIVDEEKLLFRFERAKYGIQQLVERVGFFGILAAARSALLSPSYLPYPPPFQHSKPPFRPGWNHLRALPGSLLDIFWRHPHWKGCDQDAHSGGAVFSSIALLFNLLPTFRKCSSS